MGIVRSVKREKMYFLGDFRKKMPEAIADSENMSTFALAKTKWELLYGQLLVNPPGLDRSQRSRS